MREKNQKRSREMKKECDVKDNTFVFPLDAVIFCNSDEAVFPVAATII